MEGDPSSLLRLASQLAQAAPIALVPLLGRISLGTDKETVLSGSPQRQMIMDLVRERPGLPVGDLMERVGIGWGTLYHHLAKLQRAGLLQVHKAGRRRLVYPANAVTTQPNAQGDSLFYGKTAQRIACAIAQTPHLSILELSDRVGESPRVVYYHVKRLLEGGLIVSSSTTRHRDLCPTDRLVELLQREAMAPEAEEMELPPGHVRVPVDAGPVKVSLDPARASR